MKEKKILSPGRKEERRLRRRCRLAAPFFTVLFSWLFIGERMSVRQCLCVLGALVGVV